MIGKETFHKISVVFLYLFFALSPFSISLCQIFAGASLFFLFLDCIQKRELPQFETQTLFWILLYLSFLFTPASNGNETNWKKTILGSEFGDVWMAFLLLHHTRLSYREKTKLKQAVLVGAVFLILSGLVSLLFPYRLAPYVMDGFQYIEGKRLPHLLVVLWQKLPLYLPIGFQSTHLTYGGLLAIYLPSIFQRTFRCFQIAKTKPIPYFYKIFFLASSFVGFILLFLNQSRSIWFGLLFGIFLISFQKKIKIKKYLPALSLGILVFVGIVFFLYQNNWLFQRAIDDLFAKRSLENQRVWIHKMNFAILKDFYFLGIGSGNYQTEFITQAKTLVKEFPELYYDLSITPKSHAHFDFLEFWILGGFTAVVSFLSFLYLETKLILRAGKQTGFYLGFFAIVFAGSFQCYLVDDEVLLPFLGILCLLPSGKLKNFTQSLPSKKNDEKKVFASILFWIFLSSLGALYLTKTPAKDLFFHRTRTDLNFPAALAQVSINASAPVNVPEGTKELYFKLAGCLDHDSNFNETHKVREVPVGFQIHWEDLTSGELPESIELEIRKRESFDQDKEYRVQAERIVKKVSFKNSKQIQRFQVDPKEYLGKEPEFIDFGLKYTWKGERPVLPRIEISGNCE
ncbi:O-antigen ligase family protein [Leptospira kanakyensis]|uniref:O-antigen ligase family protein n=1 Tax=Leptospira kanakyensis TaxID=2484968 RepID=A0A6N4QJ27_9LEPT|nr:O-antigen ligase family protein [Leptospira kanakyensis]TGK53753.1 O-antigen ligase family protein [Leptospira kanakyensis]TGK57548.1 O-antigen ligase family protein [Leptospira kanakyensis]TGK73258.1 O-antigen ligase family protein [Leptospira kanakyensis]